MEVIGDNDKIGVGDKNPAKRKLKNSDIVILEVYGKKRRAGCSNVLSFFFFWSQQKDNNKYIFINQRVVHAYYSEIWK